MPAIEYAWPALSPSSSRGVSVSPSVLIAHISHVPRSQVFCPDQPPLRFAQECRAGVISLDRHVLMLSPSGQPVSDASEGICSCIAECISEAFLADPVCNERESKALSRKTYAESDESLFPIFKHCHSDVLAIFETRHTDV